MSGHKSTLAERLILAFENFIARRILIDKDRQDALSRPIVGIAVLGVIIGVAVMILTLAITKGFQDEIRAKVTGSGSHIRVAAISQTDQQETPRFYMRPTLLDSIKNIQGVDHVQQFALRAGILETQEEIEGIVIKGISTDHDLSFLEKHLASGELLSIGPETTNEVLISSWQAARLRVGVDSSLVIYLIKGEDIRPRKYKVKGIYSTGMEQIDHELVIMDLAHLQKFASWGLSAQILVTDSCFDRGLKIKGLAFGGTSPYNYSWSGSDWEGPGPHQLCVQEDMELFVVVNDANKTIPDTAYLSIKRNKSGKDCACGHELTITSSTSGGSAKYYAGGYEIALNDFSELEVLNDKVYDVIDLNMRTTTIKQQFPEIFSWLELLDMNVIVVIALMIAVAIINMTSALLIIILERTSMIGVLKSLGAANRSIRRIFLIDAAYIVGIGILLGNLLGLLLAFIQLQWGIVKLPAESYYVESVPIKIVWSDILLLDLGTLLVCLVALVLPTLLVTRIAPAKAIKVLE